MINYTSQFCNKIFEIFCFLVFISIFYAAIFFAVLSDATTTTEVKEDIAYLLQSRDSITQDNQLLIALKK